MMCHVWNFVITEAEMCVLIGARGKTSQPLYACTCGLEDPGVTAAVASCKRLHHPVNLLSFSRETKAPQKLPATWKRWKEKQRTEAGKKEEDFIIRGGTRLKVKLLQHFKLPFTNLSACTRFRSENSCRPTNAFSISRCISSLCDNQNNKR